MFSCAPDFYSSRIRDGQERERLAVRGFGDLQSFGMM
jgi:hypothetical protein